jgi:hypothetical protein
MADVKVGGVYADVYAKLEKKGFEQFSKLVEKAQREARNDVQITLKGKFEASAFTSFDDAIRRAELRAASGVTVKLDADYQSANFAAFSTRLNALRAQASNKITQDIGINLSQLNTDIAAAMAALNALRLYASIAIVQNVNVNFNHSQVTTIINSLTSITQAAQGASGAMSGVGAGGGSALKMIAALAVPAALALSYVAVEAAPAVGAIAGLAGVAVNAAQGMGVLSIAFSNLGEDIDKLKGPAKTFKKFIVEDIGKELEKVRTGAQRNLFPGLTKGIKEARPAIATFAEVINKTSRMFGELAKTFGRFVGGKEFRDFITKMGSEGVRNLRILGMAGLNLGRAFMQVLLAARPLTRWFVDLIAKGAKMAKIWTSNGANQKKMVAFFGQTREALTKVGKVVGAVIVSVVKLAKRGHDMAEQIFEALKPAKPFYENVLKPLIAGFGKGLVKGVKSALAVIRVVATVLGYVGKAAKPLKPLFEGIGYVVGYVFGAGGVFGKGLAAVTKLAKLFVTLASNILTVSRALKALSLAGAAGLGNKIGNKYNNLKAKLGFRTGGIVPGDSQRDGTMIMASGGEAILTKDGQRKMDRYAPGLLRAVLGSQLPHFREGGIVGARAKVNAAKSRVDSAANAYSLKEREYSITGGEIDATEKASLLQMKQEQLATSESLARALMEGIAAAKKDVRDTDKTIDGTKSKDKKSKLRDHRDRVLEWLSGWKSDLSELKATGIPELKLDVLESQQSEKLGPETMTFSEALSRAGSYASALGSVQAQFGSNFVSVGSSQVSTEPLSSPSAGRQSGAVPSVHIHYEREPRNAHAEAEKIARQTIRLMA